MNPYENDIPGGGRKGKNKRTGDEPHNDAPLYPAISGEFSRSSSNEVEPTFSRLSSTEDASSVTQEENNTNPTNYRQSTSDIGKRAMVQRSLVQQESTCSSINTADPTSNIPRTQTGSSSFSGDGRNGNNERDEDSLYSEYTQTPSVGNTYASTSSASRDHAMIIRNSGGTRERNKERQSRRSSGGKTRKRRSKISEPTPPTPPPLYSGVSSSSSATSTKKMKDPTQVLHSGAGVPGAYSITPGGRVDMDDQLPRDAFDDSSAMYSSNRPRTNAQDSENPIIVRARVVDDDHDEDEEESSDGSGDYGNDHGQDRPDPVVAVATKLGLLSYLAHDRRSQIGAGVVVLLVIGLVVGLVVALSNNSSGGGDGSSGADAPPAESFWPQVGSHIDGPSDESQFGSSVSINGDGTRMAVGAPGVLDRGNNDGGSLVPRGVVQVYEIQEDSGEWEPLGTPILGSFMDDVADAFMPLSGVMNRIVVSMSRDGNSIAVGAPYHDEEGKKNVGQVEVFTYASSSGRWERIGEVLKGEASDDFFGASVSLSRDGGYVAIGAPGTDGNSSEIGRVSVYQINSRDWILRGNHISGLLADELIGGSVSLSLDGNYLAVGARCSPGVGVKTVVRVFRFRLGDWEEVGSGITGGDGLYDTGWMAELSGDGSTVVVSNYYMGQDGPATNSDEENSLLVSAYQYAEGSGWIPLGNHMHENEKGDKSGYFISVSDNGNIIAMGDPGRSGADGGGKEGHAHIYSYDGQHWNQVGPNIDGEAAGDMFGLSVSLSADGRYFAIGSPSNRGTGTELGRVKVYEVSDD